MMKKVIIIGAGISGLSAGIFARKSGFDTELFEMHAIAGGECTGWSRKGYHFDNCIHWLTGTNSKTELYHIWKELGAFDGTDIYYPEYLYAYNKGEKILYMYRDLERLEKHLLEISMEDKEAIREFITLIKKFNDIVLPTKKPMDHLNIIDYINLGKKYKTIRKDLANLNKISVKEYSKRFKSELIRQGVVDYFSGYFAAISLFASLGTIASGNGGWPMGGSLKMSLKIAKKFKTLGGKINYNTKVKRIIVREGIAVGVELENGKIIEGDYIIPAVDVKFLMTHLLENKFQDKIFDKQFNNPKSYPLHSSVNIGIGVACDLSHRPHQISYEVEPFQCGTQKINRIGIHHFCHEKDFAPKGKSVIRVDIMAHDYDYWKRLKENNLDEYTSKKEKVAHNVLDRIVKLYPETKNKVEVFDVATPVTYERYCGAYQGAWMAFDTVPNVKSVAHKGVIKGIKNLYIAGQWIMSPGGLPVAAVAGKWSVQKICNKEKIEFPFEY